MFKAFKVELNPNNKQITMFKKHCGTKRFVYNWALNLLNDEYSKFTNELKHHLESRKLNNLPDYSKDELKECKKELRKKYIQPNAINLHKLWIQKKNDDCQWAKDISKWTPQNSLISIENAYKRFYKLLKCIDYQKKSKKRKGKKKLKPLGFPNKKKKDNNDSFTLNKPIIVGSNLVKLPKIGKVRLKEYNYIPLGNPKSATISKKADKWFISVFYDVDIKKGDYNNDVIGVDLGVKTLAVCSDGTEMHHDKDSIKYYNKKLKRLQRKLCRQKKGSNSRNKTKQLISKIHYKISCIRKDCLHKTTTLLAKTKQQGTIVIEDLNVSGMLKNKNLSRAISEVGFYEFRRQLEYKCKWYGKKLIIADRFFASSKIVNETGEYNKELKLSDRTITLPDGSKIDRDLNASYNLRDYGIKMLNTPRYGEIEAGSPEDKGIKKEEKFISTSKGVERCSSEKPEVTKNLL